MKTIRVKILLIAILFFMGNLFAQDQKELFSLTLEELMNVEVTTASKFSEKISIVPASVVIITRKDIESYGYRNILEVVENIPGVYLHRSYIENRIGIRGFMSSQTTALFLNGVYQC